MSDRFLAWGEREDDGRWLDTVAVPAPSLNFDDVGELVSCSSGPSPAEALSAILDYLGSGHSTALPARAQALLVSSNRRTVKEAAEELGCSVRAVQRHVAALKSFRSPSASDEK